VKLTTPLSFAALLGIVTISGCDGRPPIDAADSIYVGGDIITMNDGQPTAEALAVRGALILAVGMRAEIEKAHKGPATQIVDLGGKTLLPGFLDAHSHYASSLTVANQVNVYAPPAGPGRDPESIVAELVKYRDRNQTPKGVVIQAYGYDDNAMPDGLTLNRDHLDEAFPDNPVLVGHVSMHGAVLNSAAMKKWNFSAETETVSGGVIVRKPGTNEPYGLIMEMAYLPVFASLPQPTAEQEVEWSRAGQMLYAEHGVTTANEGATHLADLELMKRASAGGATIIDVIANPFITDFEAILARFPRENWGTYENRLKIGAVKITIDGSPQGKTAVFTTPYLTGGPGGEQDWTGELSLPEPVIAQAVKAVYDLELPLNLHANGDGAIDTFLRVHAAVAADDPARDRNITMIHAQFARADQLDKFAQYKIRPSHYTLHTYYFADAHIANRGTEQAMYISPMRDAIDKGLEPTNHTDFVVAPLDQMFMLWSAVNRVSRAGAVIGADQRITPLEGLKAQTINVAQQFGEQATKGSLEPGKLADLVILDKNPLNVEPMAIKDIKVVETVKDGKTIYRAN
jgi:predicted amidohydrolase YtcJ